jgi:hypothetical protein
MEERSSSGHDARAPLLEGQSSATGPAAGERAKAEA